MEARSGATEHTWVFGDIAAGLELLKRNLGSLGEKKYVPIRISHGCDLKATPTAPCSLPVRLEQVGSEGKEK